MKEAMYIGDDPGLQGEYGFFDDTQNRDGYDGVFLYAIDYPNKGDFKQRGVYEDELMFVESEEEVEEPVDDEFDDLDDEDEYYGYWDDEDEYAD